VEKSLEARSTEAQKNFREFSDSRFDNSGVGWCSTKKPLKPEVLKLEEPPKLQIAYVWKFGIQVF
jgi:hypothetical protein